MDCRLQGWRAGLLQFRCRGVSDGNHAAGLRGVAHRQETGMGWAEDASQERARSVAVRQTRIPQRVEAVTRSSKNQAPSSRQHPNPKLQLPVRSATCKHWHSKLGAKREPGNLKT